MVETSSEGSLKVPRCGLSPTGGDQGTSHDGSCYGSSRLRVIQGPVSWSDTSRTGPGGLPVKRSSKRSYRGMIKKTRKVIPVLKLDHTLTG